MGTPRVVLVILLVLSLALAGGSLAMKRWSQGGKEIETIRLMEGPRSVYHLPQYIALALGFFKEQGLEVKVQNTANPDTLIPALATGRADVVLTDLERAIYSRAEGSVNPVAFAALTNRDNHFLVARKVPDSFQWASLKGKSVITGWPESRETVLLEGLLRQNNIAPNREVTLYTNIPASLRIGAFQSGSGDFIVLPEPQASLLEARGLGTVVASLGKEAGPLPGAVYVTTKTFMDAHPEALQRFTNAIYKAQLWLAHHSNSEITELAGPYLRDGDKNLLIRVIERYRSQDTWAAGPVIPLERYNYLMNLLDQSREVPLVIPPREMVNNQFAVKAMETVKYVPQEKKPLRLWDSLLGIRNNGRQQNISVIP